ncbi:hypothetical protein RFI_36514 [Reticulomyxa filosa]|uniref:Uncharacterized protein n=1 Tax=Reticulomyxa filosa TaxID=46433 RepID=X6LHW0_RETFI|nr:hypothetical protein RFI_36514 [Reticulomyxa filosa]|eukprot:ETO00926.1 hypothetical protein RFI_36514 [Reticulomyxa filosa]
MNCKQPKLILKSKNTMNSDEMNPLVNTLKQNMESKINEKSMKDYGGKFDQMFDIGRFTILCDDKNKLNTTTKIFFNNQSKTHYPFYNIKLFVPNYKVYIEMQAKGHSIIEKQHFSISYICINDFILFFGGTGNDIFKSVYKYSI